MLLHWVMFLITLMIILVKSWVGMMGMSMYTHLYKDASKWKGPSK
jgi:hypothetical protein